MRRRGAAGAGPALLVLLLLLLLLLLHGAHAACPACPPPPARCHYIDTATVEECFYDIDNTSKDDNFVMSASQNYVGVTCAPGMTLDSSSLPALTRRQEVSKAVLAGCGPPADGYSGLLTRLNVTVLDELHITWLPPDSLAGRHFAGLEQLSKLVLTAANATRPLEAATDLLNGTPSLTALHLSGVTLPPAALRHLPASLTTLTLSEPGLVDLSAADLPALPRLRSLYMKDRTLLTLPPLPWPALRQLVLLAPNMTGTLTLPTGLDKLMLEVGEELNLSGECRLRELTLSSATLDHLPAWVAGCTRLTWLTVRLRNLTRLIGAELANMTALRRLKLAGSQLTALPPQLFRATRNLTTLDLSRNNITSLPSNIFSRLTRLEQLDLSSNKLVARSADALWPLSALTDSLRSLALHDNPLGDLCPPTSTLIGGEQLSILPRYKQLRTLRLGRTGARRVCADWRGLPTLQQLDLRDNDITELQWSDLQWPRSNRTRVWLAGNAVRGVRVTRTQYERGGAEGGRVEVELQLNANLTCDCTVYWLARARRERRLPVSIRGLNCLQPGNVTVPLEQVDVDGMVCDVREGCPSNCSCSWHAGRNATTADCTRRGLHTLPSVVMLPGAAIELLASNNSITILPSVEALPARLRRLDLRYNSLQSLPSLKSLLPRNRSLLLRGNPLRCACSQHWLAQLPDHLAQVEDAADVVCTDGRALRAAATASCGGGGGPALPASGGAALVLLAVAALLLAALRPAARLRLKAALLARGLCPSWAAPDDDDDEYTYDAFLSYSHLDADVADELVSVLEAGPRPLRLCVHHRDWRVGGWIHAQIAESVARSRRTMILLSDNFAASSWARAEFREAYARAMRDVSARLIVVVLGDAPPAGLDPELQHYVAHNTYVRWGEPAFWEKLRLALPPGRAPRRGDKPAAADHTREQRASDPAPHPDPAPAPPTPIVKFAQIDFPATLKPPKNETSACA